MVICQLIRVVEPFQKVDSESVFRFMMSMYHLLMEAEDTLERDDLPFQQLIVLRFVVEITDSDKALVELVDLVPDTIVRLHPTIVGWWVMIRRFLVGWELIRHLVLLVGGIEVGRRRRQNHLDGGGGAVFVTAAAVCSGERIFL
jgi:hypothetical protein